MENQELVAKITEERLDGVIVNKPFYKNTLGLPEYFRFGFELEALMNHAVLIQDMMEYKKKTLFNNNTFWGVEETTIAYEESEYGGLEFSIGAEIVTPILTDSEETWRDIVLACKYLQENAECTQNCSVHINVGAQALGSNYQNWYHFLQIIAACEPEIYRYFANGEQIRAHAISGGFRKRYAMPVAQYIRNGLEKCDTENIQDINTLLNYCSFNGEYQERKDKSVSLKALYENDNKIMSYEKLDEPAYGRRIEIRMPNGTFDATLIQGFTYITARIIEVARTLTSEQSRKLKQLLEREIPSNYNEPVNISRVLDVANLLFTSREDKLQFLYTTCGREKMEKKLSDRTEIIKLIQEENMILEFVPEELKDREIVLEAVKHGGGELQYASEGLRDDEEVVLAAVQKYGRALQFANPRWQKDRRVVLKAVKSNGFALQYADSELKLDREIAFEAVKSKAFAIQYIDESLRNDKEIALTAVIKDGLCVQFLSPSLKKDKDVGITAVTENKSAIYQLDESIMLDKDILWIIYDKNQYMKELLGEGHISKEKEESFFRYATSDNIIYKYLLKEAMQGNLIFEKYLLGILSVASKESQKYGNHEASDRYSVMSEYILEKVELAKRKDLILKFLEVDGNLLEQLSEKEKEDQAIVRVAIKNTPLALKYASPNMQATREIVLEAVRKRGEALAYASSDLREDKNIVLEAIRNEGTAIAHASEELRKDKQMAIEAVRQYASAAYEVDKSLWDDKDFAIELVKANGSYLQNLNADFRNDKSVVLAAISNKAFVIEMVSEELKNDREIGLAAVAENGYLLCYLSERLRADRGIVLTALRNYSDSIKYASPDLQAQKAELLAEIEREKMNKKDGERVE